MKFDLVKSAESLEVSAADVVELFVSNNDNMAAVEGYTLQACIASVVVVRTKGGAECYIHFAMLENGRGVVFRCRELIQKQNFETVMGHAMDFVESMGFLMDNKDFRRQTDAQKARIISETPVFDQTLGVEGQSESLIFLEASASTAPDYEVEIEVEPELDLDVEVEAETILLEDTASKIPIVAKKPRDDFSADSVLPTNQPKDLKPTTKLDPKDEEKWNIVSRILAAF